MIPVDEALRRLSAAVAPLAPVERDLERARLLALAEPVHADRDFPPTDRSAMDGFAVRSADAATPDSELRVVGEVRAGQAAEGVRVGPRQAVRIYTGAVVPDGADAVVMVEHTEEDREDGIVRLARSVVAAQNVRRRGSDCRAGETVVEAGTPIRAAEIAALASVGAARVRVHPAPVVHVLSTGDEIVEPEAVPAAHQVRNSNGPALLAQLAELGLTGRYLGNAGDRPDELAARLAAGLRGDVLLVTGGVSVGEYDLVGRALAEAGVQTLFHGVAMKPGKPILAGRREGCLVVGLPGNPVSAHVGFCVLVAPVLRKLLGYRRWANVELPATLERPLRCRPGRATYHLARLRHCDGRLLAAPVASTGSGDVLSLARANGLLLTPPEVGGELSSGANLPALPWDLPGSQ